MPSDKTKKLLEGLGKITNNAPSRFEAEKLHSYTNMFYTSNPHQLPKKYDKVKRKKDEDGEEYIMIDRIYGSIFKGQAKLRQADGSIYKNKLTSKRRLIKSKDPITKEEKSFYSHCTVTADGRWFNNGGMPIEKPEQFEKTTSELLMEGFEEEQKQREEEDSEE